MKFVQKALAREPHVVRLEDYRMNDSRHELEVLLLMEYCTCSLLDAMNQSRLRSEQDIYSIFSQVSLFLCILFICFICILLYL